MSDVQYIPPGFRTEKEAWDEAKKYTKSNNAIMARAKKMGVKISVSVRKKGSLFYVVIIKN